MLPFHDGVEEPGQDIGRDGGKVRGLSVHLGE